MLYVVSKVMECETFFNEAPFNSIESFAKIKLYKKPRMLCIFVCSTTLSTNLIVFPPPPPPQPCIYLLQSLFGQAY